jgi:competence ComEA-like helix-hairpin-helix protein
MGLKSMSAFPLLETRPIIFALVLLAMLLSALSCAKRAHDPHATIAAQANDQSAKIESSTSRININVASAKELETLPGIGKSLAERIIEHREKYGPFRRSEHLILVRGISDRRYRAIQNQISVE